MLLSCSCTPQQRLNRLLKKHPELVRTDTVYIDTFAVRAPFQADTTGKVNTDFSGIDSIFAHLPEELDSAQKVQVVTDIKNYFITRPCITDTMRLSLRSGGVVKVWQDGQEIKISIYEPAEKIPLRVPTTINTVTQKPGAWSIIPDWLWKVGWFAAIAFLLLLILSKRKEK
jgi:hypothetical protein